MQTKFHVPRSHSVREKCDDNLQKFKVVHSPLLGTVFCYYVQLIITQLLLLFNNFMN